MQMDDKAFPLEVRVVRKGGAGDTSYREKEMNCLLALLGELETLSETPEVEREKRLITFPEGVLQAARVKVAAGLEASEEDAEYTKAAELLKKKARFEQGIEALRRIQKGLQ